MTSYFCWRSFRWNPLSRLYLSANELMDISIAWWPMETKVCLFTKRPGCSATLMCTRAKPSRSCGYVESRMCSSTLHGLSAEWKANRFKGGLFQTCRRFLCLNASMVHIWCKLTRLPKRLALFATFFLQKAWCWKADFGFMQHNDYDCISSKSLQLSGATANDDTLCKQGHLYTFALRWCHSDEESVEYSSTSSQCRHMFLSLLEELALLKSSGVQRFWRVAAQVACASCWRTRSDLLSWCDAVTSLVKVVNRCAALCYSPTSGQGITPATQQPRWSA